MSAPRLLAAVLLLVALAAHAAAPARKPTCHALLIGGMPAAPVYARRYRDWLARFHAHLSKTTSQIVVLTGDPDFQSPIVSGKATAAAIRDALATFAGAVREDDQFVLVLIGHGAAADAIPTVIQPRPDHHAQPLADAHDAIQARHQVVLNFTASSGDSLRFLAADGRVNVAATSPTEVTEPVLPEFFLRALEAGKPVTVLDALNLASHQAAMWITRLKSTPGGWRVDGKESVAIFKKLALGPDGEPAARKLSPRSNANVPDQPVELRPRDGNIDAWWRGRRIVAEHAMLEDCGEERGETPLRGKGYEPINGARPGQPGHLARRVVLGSPALLPEHPK